MCICNLFECIQDNFKDFVNICFWIFTCTLAYKTYVNAKKTLFNPIRSEMVKYQMKAITEFIDNHTSKGFNLDFSIDYLNLVKINFDTDYLIEILTNEYKSENHYFDDIENARLNYCKENLAGLFEIVKENNKLSFDSIIIGDFDSTKQYTQTKIIKSKEETNKELSLQRFYFTKKFYLLYSDLINLETNPFIPKEIKLELKNTTTNILKNIQILYTILSMYISEQKPTIYQEVLSEFNNQKISHDDDLKKLREVITKYFKVNIV